MAVIPSTCDAAVYASLKFCNGETVLPGIRSRVYYISKANIATWPTVVSDWTVMANDKSQNAAHGAAYSGNFTLASDAHWDFIDLVANNGSVTWETQGEAPSQTIKNTASFKHARIDAAAASVQSLALNSDLVFLVQQRDGFFRVIGSEAFVAEVSVSGGTGEDVTSSDAGSTFEVSCTDTAPAPFYFGTITTEDGDISADPTSAE